MTNVLFSLKRANWKKIPSVGYRTIKRVHDDNVLKTTGEKVLQGAGTISHAQAIEKATEEYRKYQAQNLSPVEEEYLESIKNIQSIVKKKDNN